MADLHIDDFYKDAARILAQLYNAFPRKAAVYVEDISGPDSPDEYGLHSPRHQACFSAMLWLAEEGYVRYVDTIRQEAIDQAVLTHKAFVLLNSPAPVSRDTDEAASALPERVSHIQRLRHAIAAGSSRALGAAMSDLLAPPAR